MVQKNLIYTAADGSYALQAQALFQSLALTQNRPTELRIFGSGWSRSDLTRLQGLATDRVRTTVVPVNDNEFNDVRLDSGFPLATAYNILAPKHFISENGRALYLDADMVVTEDLASLFDRNMNTAVAAVVDAHVAVTGSPSMWRPWREESVDPLSAYLNTGTLLIDLDKWREDEITEKTLMYLAKYEMPCVDQDALNLVLRGNFDRLEPRYNMMPYHLLTMFRNADLVETPEDIERAVVDPAIIHFHRSFFGKPWTFGATHPGTKLWRQLASDARPRWRRSLDLFNFARGRGARLVGMMKTDERMRQFTRVDLKAS